MTDIVIDVVSDVMCPWCFVGKKRLEKALSEVGEDVDVAVNWRPYQLDPTIPPGGKDRRAYFAEKFGDMQRVAEMHRNLAQIGIDVGIDFDFEAIEVSPNTLDAHRLIRWAEGAGVQERVVERLFELFFMEGRNIGDRAVLLELADEVGMDVAAVEAMLAAEADVEDVRQEIDQARMMGVTGVPCFILDNKYAIVGAQSPDVIEDAIRKVAAMKTATTD